MDDVDYRHAGAAGEGQQACALFHCGIDALQWEKAGGVFPLRIDHEEHRLVWMAGNGRKARDLGQSPGVLGRRHGWFLLMIG